MSLPELEGLLRDLVESEIEFVVIGGVAVGLHGFIRATEDLDIVPSPESTNLDRLSDFLVDRAATLLLNPARRYGSRERWALARGRNISVSTPRGDLDVVQGMPGIPPYQELRERCVEYELDDFTVRVASSQDLIAMKEARGSERDRGDIAALTEEQP